MMKLRPKQTDLSELLQNLESHQECVRIRDMPMEVDEIGEGATGRVCSYERADGQQLAGKIAKINRFNRTKDEEQKLSKSLRHALNEAYALLELNHKNVVKFFGCYWDKKQFVLFTELMHGGSVRSLICENKLPENLAIQFSIQAAEGLSFLHSRKPTAIIHRDIKSDNLLLDESRNNVKLADFGLALEISIRESVTLMTQTCGSPSFAGTVLFAAPEVQENFTARIVPYGRKADVWSLACTIVEMLNGVPPFSEKFEEIGLYEFVRCISQNSNELRYSGDLVPDKSSFIKDLLNYMFIREIEHRPRINDVLKFLRSKQVSTEEMLRPESKFENAEQLDSQQSSGESENQKFSGFHESNEDSSVSKLNNLFLDFKFDMKIDELKSNEQQNDHIRKHFKKFNFSETELHSKCDAIESVLKKNYSLRELAKSSLMLTYLCLLQDEMKQITKPALLDTIVKLLIQRFDKKYPEKKILHLLAENAIEIAEHHDAEAVEKWRQYPQIRRLGKLAFNVTLQKKFVLEGKDLGTGDSAVNGAAFEGIGLLSKTTHSYQFMHRAMQEFFSALYFLYWQNDTFQHVKTLITDGGSINSDHRDFVQMTFDVLMAERKEAALISISPFLSEIQSLYYFDGSAIRLQSQSVDELRKEHAFFQSIMRNCKKIVLIGIDGMGAAVDFAWTIKLPHDHHGGKIGVRLFNFNFVGTNELLIILSVNCSDHVQLEVFGLYECKFEPERLRLTVDGYLSHLKLVQINLTPEMMEKLSILPDSRFTPSQWSGNLELYDDDLNNLNDNDSSKIAMKKLFPRAEFI